MRNSADLQLYDSELQTEDLSTNDENDRGWHKN